MYCKLCVLPSLELHNEKAIQLSISEGDERAFAVLFNHYYPLLRPLVAGYALTEADREEILQETFIRVWMYRDKLPEIDCLKNWIFRVASRECLTMLRKNLQYKKQISEVQGHVIVMSQETPAEKYYLSEISRLVQQAVDQMPPRRRLIYQMSRVEGMKPSEIAEKLSLSVNTVKNVLSASLKYIRDYLAAAGVFLLILSFFFLNI